MEDFQQPPSRESDFVPSVSLRTGQWTQRSAWTGPKGQGHHLYCAQQRQWSTSSGHSLGRRKKYFRDSLHPTAACLCAWTVIALPCKHLPLPQISETSKKHFGRTREPSKTSSWEKMSLGQSKTIATPQPCNENKGPQGPVPSSTPNTPAWVPLSTRKGVAAGGGPPTEQQQLPHQNLLGEQV